MTYQWKREFEYCRYYILEPPLEIPPIGITIKVSTIRLLSAVSTSRKRKSPISYCSWKKKDFCNLSFMFIAGAWSMEVSLHARTVEIWGVQNKCKMKSNPENVAHSTRLWHVFFCWAQLNFLKRVLSVFYKSTIKHLV